jgi:hypothetical protein
MTLLVTQEMALRQLRLSATAITSDELADVMFKAEQASDIVVDYIKAPGAANYVADYVPVVNPLGGRVYVPDAPPADLGNDDFDPTPSPPPPPRVPQTAWTSTTCPVMIQGVVLMLLTALYDGRTPNDALLSDQISDVLCRYRDPALA